MNFRIGEPPKKQAFDPEQEGWISLKEPSMLTAQLIGFPIGIILTLITLFLAIHLTDFIWFSSFHVPSFIVGCLLCIAVHELIHAISFPKEKGEQIFLGFWPKAFAFYAFYTGKMSRNRFFVCLLAPFFSLSISPILIMSVFETYNEFWITLCLFNAFASYADVLGACIVLQVPRNGYVLNDGWKSYWKADHRFESNRSLKDNEGRQSLGGKGEKNMV